MHCGYFDTTRKRNHSLVSDVDSGLYFVGDAPFRLKFALKVTYPFEKRRLRQISACNV